MTLFKIPGVLSKTDRLHRIILSFLPAQEREQQTLPFTKRSPFAMRREYDAVITELKDTPKEEYSGISPNKFIRVLARPHDAQDAKQYYNVPPLIFLKLKKKTRGCEDAEYRAHSHRDYLSLFTIEQHGGIFGNALDFIKREHSVSPVVFIERFWQSSSPMFGRSGWLPFKLPPMTKSDSCGGFCTVEEIEEHRQRIIKYLRQNGFKVSHNTYFKKLFQMLMSF